MQLSDHRLIRGDSSSSPSIEDESVALVLTSPPYPMIEMWDSLFATRNQQVRLALESYDGPAAFTLMHEDLNKVWTEVARVLLPGGWACINIGDATRKVGDRFQLYSNHSLTISKFASLGFDILPLILWRKQTNAPNKFMGSGMLPAGAYVTLEHEYILIMRKGTKREFKTADDKLVRQQSAFFWEERNKWFSDIWDFKGTRQKLRSNELRERSAAFPFELPYRLINMYSVRGDTVFDPFLGTGTTTYAAMASGRNSIGVDLDSSFIDAFAKECPNLRNQLNQQILDRIREHNSFVEQCRNDGKDLGYINGPHGFPVMTSQEVNLLLLLISDIKPIGQDHFRASYRPIGDDLDREMGALDSQLTLAM